MKNRHGGDRANFLIFADLSEIGFEGHWEQLWTKQLGANEFALCCIPYFTYGVALGDRLCTASRRGRDYVLSKVVSQSGHRVLRLWLKHARLEARERIQEALVVSALLHGRNSVNLVAIDVADPAKIPAALNDLLADLSALSIDAEWGD
jgi:Domain of unknown function (DUF4265)